LITARAILCMDPEMSLVFAVQIGYTEIHCQTPDRLAMVAQKVISAIIYWITASDLSIG